MRSVPFVLRLLSGIGGVVVVLIALVVSLGAALAAPLGMHLVHRRDVRRNRRPSRLRSVIGAVLASSALAAAVWIVLFAVAPRPTQQELKTAVTEAQTRPTVKLPGWYARAFPQAAQTDSATQKMLQSPEFMATTLVIAAIFVALFFGALGGTLGWCGAQLLRVAWFG